MVPYKTDSGSTDPLGAMLRRARHSQPTRLTQEDVAKRMEVGQSTISAWESGRARPNYADLMKLARLLDLDVGDLVAAAANGSNGHT